MKTLLIGYGCVGKGFYDILKKYSQAPLNLKTLCVKDPEKPRDGISGLNISYNAIEEAGDESYDLIAEAIDDADYAAKIAGITLKSGRNYVTANKKMVALQLQQLLTWQKEYKGNILYEAACCASIPIVHLLDHYFSNHPIDNISGILNGSSNYILDQVIEKDLTFEAALKQAQEAGFAENDPTLDIEGYDAAYKLTILIWHALGIIIHPDAILRTGIQGLSQEDVEFASKNDLKIKPVAYAGFENGKIKAFVMPAIVSRQNPLYNVDQENNGIALNGKLWDQQFFSGKGAGAFPTGSAVFSDVQNIRQGFHYKIPEYIPNTIKVQNDFAINVSLKGQWEIDATQHFAQLDSKKQENDYQRLTGKIKYSELNKLTKLSKGKTFAGTLID